VDNPSALFMGDGGALSTGTAVTALIEGTRPVLVEIQALATKAGYGTAQRVAHGVDQRRLALLLAVLEKRSGIPVSQLDIFVNVAGGLRLNEPAGDLAIAAAVASSVYDVPLPNGSVFIGELGLGGEIRAVSQADRRLAEAAQLGMTVAHIGTRGQTPRSTGGLRVATHEHLGAMFQAIFRS
jgi:DNA repair protein RadA/Sms